MSVSRPGENMMLFKFVTKFKQKKRFYNEVSITVQFGPIVLNMITQ